MLHGSETFPVKKEVQISVGLISNIDVEIATLPKIALRSKSRFCLSQLSIFNLIFIKNFCLYRY